jgi:alanyl-tRNA synthetase
LVSSKSFLKDGCSGIRRIEAITGNAVKKVLQLQESLLSEIKMTLKNCKIVKLPLFYRKIMQLKKK